MTWSQHCIKVNVPEISKCEPPKIKTRKGCLYPQPETASCTWPEIKSGKGCACAGGYMRKHGECVKEVVSCDWPKIRVGPGCMCAPGFVPAGSGCTRVVIVDPGNQEPRHEAPPPQQVEEPQGPPPPPPPPQRAEEPKPKPKPQAVAQVEAPIRCLPQDLYDLLTEAYGKRPGVGPCPTACLPKPAFLSPAKLDEVATRPASAGARIASRSGPYMPLASINKLEALAHLTICVSPESCVYPGGTPAEPRTEIRTVFKTMPAGVKNEDNLAVVSATRPISQACRLTNTAQAMPTHVTALLTEQLGCARRTSSTFATRASPISSAYSARTKIPAARLRAASTRKTWRTCSSMSQVTAMVREDDAKAVYLLPVAPSSRSSTKTGYALQELYDNLGKTGARTTMLVTPVGFGSS
jgi:hypothetical protein